MPRISASETKLIGQWLMSEGSVVGDENCTRIEQLIEEDLKKVASTDAGWTSLYVDPRDGRYWELTYPNSDWHGGGPPSLTCLSVEEVKERYGIM